MTAKLAFPIIVTILMIVAFIVGIFTQAPELTLPFLCLAWPIGVWVGRASKAMKPRRLAVLNDREIAALERMRQSSKA